MTDWIEWRGGEQPVEDSAWIEARFQNGMIGVGYASKAIWVYQPEPSDFDIVAYRVISQDSELYACARRTRRCGKRWKPR